MALNYLPMNVTVSRDEWNKGYSDSAEKLSRKAVYN